MGIRNAMKWAIGKITGIIKPGEEIGEIKAADEVTPECTHLEEMTLEIKPLPEEDLKFLLEGDADKIRAATVANMAEENGITVEQLEEAMKIARESIMTVAEAIEQVKNQIVKAMTPVFSQITKQISMIGMDKWDRMLLEESNNHRKLHKKPMIRRRQLRRIRKKKKKG